MLLKFSVENFMSISEKQVVDFTITKKDKINDSSTEICNKYVNNINCILGSNGSGKSNLIKAMTFAINLSFDSYKNNNPLVYNKFKLSENKNTKFEIDFISNNEIYNYKIVLDKDKILEEELNVKKERKNNIFILKRKNNNVEIKTSFKTNQNDIERLKNLNSISALSFFINTGYLKDINNILGYSNLGKEDMPLMLKVVISNQLLLEYEKNFKNIFVLIKNLIKNSINFGFDDLFFAENTNPFFKSNKEVFFKHKDKNTNKFFNLSLSEESLGTQEAIFLIITIIGVINSGKIMLIDEIENRIHPFIVEKLISLFADRKINTKNAQILFSTHQPYLINELTKTQIFFTEKENLETEIYRLDEVEGVRNDDNFYNKYMNGVYGGVPEVR